VQVDPIKPTLKPPGTKHWRLKCDELLSSLPFKFRLRRYTEGDAVLRALRAATAVRGHFASGLATGRTVQVDPIKPTLKAPRTKRLKRKYDELVSNVSFKFNLRRYTPACATTRRTSPWCSVRPGASPRSASRSWRSC